MTDQTPSPKDADGELVAEWMESLGFEKRKTSSDFIAYFPTSKDANIGMVRLDQAAFFHQQFQSEKAKAVLEATESLISRLSAWAVDHDLMRGSYKKVTFDVDEWNAIREELAKRAALKQGPTNAK